MGRDPSRQIEKEWIERKTAKTKERKRRFVGWHNRRLHFQYNCINNSGLVTLFHQCTLLFSHHLIFIEDDDCGIDSYINNKEIEANVLRILTDAALSLPVDSKIICGSVSTEIGYQISHTVVCNLLQKFAAQELIKLDESTQDDKSFLTISHAEHVRLIAVVNEEHKSETPKKRKRKWNID